MRKLTRFLLVTAALFLFIPSALAHPGHGEPGPAHYLVEPEHAGVTVLAVFGLVVLAVAVLWKPAKARYFK